MKHFDPSACSATARHEHEERVQQHTARIESYLSAHPAADAAFREGAGPLFARTGGELTEDQFLRGIVRRYAGLEADLSVWTEESDIVPALLRHAERAAARADVAGRGR